MASKRSVLHPGAGAVSDYYDWWNDAFHGDVLVYHTGDLQYDRQLEYDETDPSQKDDWIKTTVLDQVATTIVLEAKHRKVLLTQKKLEESVYEYRATRIRPNDKRVRGVGVDDEERVLT